MTRRLYDENVRLREFTATVRACWRQGDIWAVTLDQTAFFPEGGGQGADHGALGDARVLDARERDGEVVHLTDRPLTVGESVIGRVDSVRRMDMMQQHTGDHIFSGIVHRLYGYDNVGFHIGTEAMTMDFNGPLSDEDVRRVELLANEVVWADLPVRCWVPEKEELAGMTYRSKKAIDGDLRIVHIEGVDTTACCGTHVEHTGSVGIIKVIGAIKYKGGVRVSVLCGRRALEEINEISAQAKSAAVALSCKPAELNAAVERVLAERDALRANADALALRVFEGVAQREAPNAVRVAACDVLPAAMARKAAGRLAEGARIALVLTPKESGWNFALCSETEDVRPVCRALTSQFGGKGGGPRDMAQGVLSGGDETEIRAALEELLG